MLPWESDEIVWARDPVKPPPPKKAPNTSRVPLELTRSRKTPEWSAEISSDSQGNIYVAGLTAESKSTIPTTTDAFQGQYSNPASGTMCPLNCNNGFVVETNSTGSRLIYGNYFGPQFSDTKITSVALASDGSLYFSGSTNTTTLQPTPR